MNERPLSPLVRADSDSRRRSHPDRTSLAVELVVHVGHAFKTVASVAGTAFDEAPTKRHRASNAMNAIFRSLAEPRTTGTRSWRAEIPWCSASRAAERDSPIGTRSRSYRDDDVCMLGADVEPFRVFPDQTRDSDRGGPSLEVRCRIDCSRISTFASASGRVSAAPSAVDVPPHCIRSVRSIRLANGSNRFDQSPGDVPGSLTGGRESRVRRDTP